MGYYKLIPRGTTGGWVKDSLDAQIGGPLGIVFDNSILKEGDTYYQWFSWRPVMGIAFTTSKDGVNWELPRMVMTKQQDKWWAREEVNRPCVLFKDGKYHMWFIGMVRNLDVEYGFTTIGYATSTDKLHWDIHPDPVMTAELPWEKTSLFCPHVIWDEEQQLYRMWYSGGEQLECDAIGYATSPDGIHWTKCGLNPIFTRDPNNFWDSLKVEACYVVPHNGWYYMFYLGMSAERWAAIGLARSKDGVTGWERHPDNPIIAGSEGYFDWLCVCKPTVLKTEDGFTMWYNGTSFAFDDGEILEEMGMAHHKGFDLWPEDGAPLERDMSRQVVIENELYLGLQNKETIYK